MITLIVKISKGDNMYTDDDEKYSYKNSRTKFNDKKDSNPYTVTNTNSINNDAYLDYDIYNADHDDEVEVKKEKRSFDKKRLIKLSIIIILLIILSILIYFIMNTSNLNPRIELVNNTLSIHAGETSAIAYEIVDTEQRIPVAFVSMNEEIVTVDEYGSVYGKSRGNTTITIIYYINGNRYEEKCEVIVN